MKRRRAIEIIILGLIFLGGCEWICNIGVKCNRCEFHSENKEAARKEGSYLVDYQPLTQTVRLKYHNEVIVFDTAWAENTWFYDTDICLLRHKEKGKSFNVVFPFHKSNPSTFLFSMDIFYFQDDQIYESGGGMGEGFADRRLVYLPDTIWVKIQEKHPDANIGWQQGLEGDTIQFVKKKNQPSVTNTQHLPIVSTVSTYLHCKRAGI
jgi:hypothetical protein